MAELASESQHEESNTPSISSPKEDEEKMTSGRWLGLVLYIPFSALTLTVGCSVTAVAGICKLVGGGVFFDMPPRKYWSVSRLGLLIGNRWMLQLKDHSGCPGMC